MPQFEIPLLLTVEAESYAYAEREAEYFIEGTPDENLIVINSWEEDNEGQRVLTFRPSRMETK